MIAQLIEKPKRSCFDIVEPAVSQKQILSDHDQDIDDELNQFK